MVGSKVDWNTHGNSYSHAEISCNLLVFVFLSNQGFVLLRFVLNPPPTTHDVRLVAQSKSKTEIPSATSHSDYDPSWTSQKGPQAFGSEKSILITIFATHKFTGLLTCLSIATAKIGRISLQNRACGFGLKVGLGISETNADSQLNPVYNEFHRIFGVETKRFVGSTINVILTRQTCGQRSSGAAGPGRQTPSASIY